MKRIAMFYGGRSFEREISILSAIQAGTFFPGEYELLPIYMADGKLYLKKDYKVFSSYIDGKNGKEVSFTSGGLKTKLKYYKIDCALVVNHGGEGEDGTLSALLEYYDIPYTSASHSASCVCMDKRLTKIVLSSYGFCVTPEWNKTDYPCILKPTVLGSSIGIQIANNAEEYEKCKEAIREFGDYIVEPLLTDAQELNCAVCMRSGTPVASVIERPIRKSDILDFDDKYRSGEREIPAEIDEDLKVLIQKTSIRIYKKLSLFGVVRIDYLYRNGELFVNEINTVPGSLSYYLFSESGTNFETLLRTLIEEGIARGNKKRPQYDTGVIRDYALGFKGTKTK